MREVGAYAAQWHVSDRVASPPEYCGHYSEKMLYVPHSFLVNSHSLSFELPRPADADGTADGLEPHAPEPHGGLVIACFNTLYKLDRDVFELWASVLRSVRRLPTCALWVLRVLLPS